MKVKRIRRFFIEVQQVFQDPEAKTPAWTPPPLSSIGDRGDEGFTSVDDAMSYGDRLMKHPLLRAFRIRDGFAGPIIATVTADDINTDKV